MLCYKLFWYVGQLSSHRCQYWGAGQGGANGPGVCEVVKEDR